MTNYRLPVRIEILSSAENVSSLDNDEPKPGSTKQGQT
jgi:hypothetical protein